MGYKNRAIKSVFWMSGLNIVTRLISLVKFVVIARVLSPSDLGVFGIVVLVVGASEIFSDLGIQTFLIQLKSDIKKYIDSAWSLQVMRGFLLFGLILILALPVSSFFKNNYLVFAIFVSSFNPLIKGFENIYIVNFQKNLMFNKQFIYKFIIVIADFVISVAFTITLHSVIGLVLGLLFSSLSGVIYSWICLREKPKFDFDKSKYIKIFHYSKWINLNGIVYYITTQLDTITIGKILGTSSLGLYQLSQNFSFTPIQELSDIFSQVSFPLYSKIAKNVNRLKRAYIKIFLCVMGLEIIIAIFLLIFSKEVILIMLGPKWIVTESIFKLFVIYGLIYSLVNMNGSLFLSVGKQDLLSKLSILRIIILIPLIIFFIILFGLQGAVYALSISLLIVLPIYLFNVFKLFGGKTKIVAYE